MIEYGQRVQNLPSLFFNLTFLPARVRRSFFFFPRVSLSQITLPVAHVFSLSLSLLLLLLLSLCATYFPLTHTPLAFSLAFALLVTEVCCGEKRDDGGPS